MMIAWWFATKAIYSLQKGNATNTQKYRTKNYAYYCLAHIGNCVFIILGSLCFMGIGFLLTLRIRSKIGGKRSLPEGLSAESACCEALCAEQQVDGIAQRFPATPVVGNAAAQGRQTVRCNQPENTARLYAWH
jgi:hypothetical protein